MEGIFWKWLGRFSVIVILSWPMTSAASYANYTYTDANDNNYHYKETTASKDGSVLVAVGGSDINATENVTVFSPNSTEPIWVFSDIGDSVIFDVALSRDGKTAVACGSGIWLLDIAHQKLLWAFDDDWRVWDTCDISADGSVIIAGNRQSSVASWHRSSSEIVRYWTFVDGGFVDKVTLTNNGVLAIAENSYSYGLIQLNQDSFVWQKTTDVEIYDIGFNKINGKRGYIDLDDGFTGTDEHYLRGINMHNGTLTWSKKFNSYNTPRVQMSNNGKRIMLTTNDKYYGLKGNGKTVWEFTPAGQETYLNMSATGKFITVAEGLNYVYFFDWDYPEYKHRPFQVDRVDFASRVAVSNNGSTVGYGANDYVVQQTKPGILVDTHNVPVYRAGNAMELSYFVSNPGEKKNLKVRTSLSLPQVAVLSDLGATVSGDPKNFSNKLLDYANATLPGYEIVDTQDVIVKAHNSKNITSSITIPDMIMPDWVGDFLTLVGLDDAFSTLMGDYAEPLNDLVSSEINNELVNGAEAGVSGEQGAYALLGIGQAELYDAETNEVYSTDTFYFMYLAL